MAATLAVVRQPCRPIVVPLHLIGPTLQSAGETHVSAARSIVHMLL